MNKIFLIQLLLFNCMTIPSDLEKIKTPECHFTFQKFQENYHEKRAGQIVVFNLGLGNMVFWGTAGSWVFIPIVPLQIFGYIKSQDLKKIWRDNQCE